MRLADIDYHLPEEAVAQTPAEPRHAARLLVVTPSGYSHRHMRDLPELLRPGDLVVANESRVMAARVRARRPGGAPAEVLFLRPSQGTGRSAKGCWWEALVRPSRKIRPGTWLDAGPFRLEVGEASADGHRLVRALDATVEEVQAAVGVVPLPPYVRAPLADSERYQTTFARRPGSTAAPTAGLHLSDEVRAGFAPRNIGWATIDLEVGVDTFRPVRSDDPADHPVHAERFRVPADTAAAINATRAGGGRVVAVGTTTVRALESAACAGGMAPQVGETRLYIQPRHRFAAIDALLTNFHAPRSTLLVLLTAVMGPAWRDAYREALQRGYRFLSLGDAMLVSVAR